MKAWKINNPYEDYATVVFAETRGKAKVIAQRTEVCEDLTFIEIIIHRYKEADSQYRGHLEMDWYDHDDKMFLLSHGWYCDGDMTYDYCKNCEDRDACKKWKDIMEELKGVLKYYETT